MRVPVELNWWDRLVSVFSPERALRNGMMRAKLAAGAHLGASTVSRAMRGWYPGGGSADADSLAELPLMRERSRDMIRNEPIAGTWVRDHVSNTIGSGLVMQSAPELGLLAGVPEEAVEAFQEIYEPVFEFWGSRKTCDYERRQPWSGVCSLGLRSMHENGDVLGIIRSRPSMETPFQTCVQLIEADRLANPDGRNDGMPDPRGRGNTVSGGVEHTADGEPVAYWILDQHPGTRGFRQGPRTWRRVPARNSLGHPLVLHAMRPLRVGQSRGIPTLASVTERIHQLTGYDKAMIDRAMIDAFFAVAITRPSGTTIPQLAGWDDKENAERAGAGEVELASGMATVLPPGAEVKTIASSAPNSQYDPFTKALRRTVTARLGSGEGVLMRSLDASFSAARAEIALTWRTVFEERDLWAEMFCQPVNEAVLFEAVALDIVSAPPGYFEGPLKRYAWTVSEWQGPPQIQLDPVKEAIAARILIEEELATRTDMTATLSGGDWDSKHKRRAIEERRRREDGTAKVGAPAQQQPQAQEPAGAPASEGTQVGVDRSVSE